MGHHDRPRLEQIQTRARSEVRQQERAAVDNECVRARASTQ